METTLGGGATQLTPLTTGRDNRSVPPLYTAAETPTSRGSRAKARSFRKSPAGLGDSARWLDTQASFSSHRDMRGGDVSGWLSLLAQTQAAIQAVEAAMKESLTPG